MNQYLQYIQSYENAARQAEVAEWIRGPLAAFFKKGNELDVTQVEHILDYLGSDRAPRRLRRMSVAQAMEAADKWTAALQKKGAHIIENAGDTETVLTFKDGSRLARLIGKAAFEREGFLMKHCVGSYAGRTDVCIYSLRDKNNQPHATFEVNRTHTEATQVKGKGNGSIQPKYVHKVLAVLEHFKLDVRESELEHLGYILPDKEMKALLQQCANVPYAIIKGKAYVYVPEINKAVFIKESV